MKKLSVISLLLAVLMLTAVVPAFAADLTDADVLKVNTKKTDILEGAYYEYDATSQVLSSASDKISMLNDGIIAATAASKGKVYLNQKCMAKQVAENLDKTTWKHEINGRKYAYVVRFDLAKKATVNGFALYTSRDANNTMVFRQNDNEFDILVSKDNGKTWKVVFESVRMVTETIDNVVTIKKSAGFPKDKGGNMEFVTDGDFGYAKCEADFTAEKGVTNVMYACSGLRTDDSSDLTDEQGNPYLKIQKGGYYCSRISEFDFYGSFDADTPDTPATGDATAILVLICGAALTMGASIVIRRKKED